MKRATYIFRDSAALSGDFNPRPREEGDFVPVNLLQGQKYFNPRPREEGDSAALSCQILLYYFNPRPREEGDRYHEPLIDSKTISIHALVKRATGFEMSFLLPYLISIHALVKRATKKILNCGIKE